MVNKPTVVMTSGVFDLLHRGHLNILWRSKQLGDVLVVGVITDEGTALYKGRRPVESLRTRMARIAALGFVDVVIEQQSTDPSPLVERFRPDVFTHGSDWTKLREGQETLERLGVEWVLLPYTEGISTTTLREKMPVTTRSHAGWLADG